MKAIYEKYKSVIMYLVFGVLTTLVNIVSYYVSYELINLKNVISTVIAWVLSVIFAYITNKIYVFGSKSFKFKDLVSEFLSFLSCRLLTGALDVAIMYISVDMLAFNNILMKILSNIVVVILNYIFSKIFVFKKG